MFDGILGNEKIKQELLQTINSNKLSHSYLFLGTEGIGKKLIAKEFARNIFKYNMQLENNPDFEMIEPDGLSIKIDQIRKMQKKVLEAPIKSEKKVYIINNADLMTGEAQNCLLKTLEEPPEFVVIILIGSVESNFLSTIKSRCTIFKFRDLSNEEIIKYLKDKYDMTEISNDMLMIFSGSIGRAEKYRNKQELYNSIFEIIQNIKRLDLIDFLKKSDKIYEYQDEKYEILENMNICFFQKAKEDIRFLNCISIIEDTKKRLISNGNYNMCIDNMLFRLWEELH